MAEPANLAELAELEREARADAAPPPGGTAAPGEAVPPRTESREEWRDTLKFAIGMASTAYPQLKPIYTEPRIEELATSLHAVAAKHGWSLGGFLTRWKEEIALLMVAGPLLGETAKALRPGKAPAGLPPAARPAGATVPIPPDVDQVAAQAGGTLTRGTGDGLTL